MDARQLITTARPDELRGKRVLVVFGSYHSKQHLYARARELGLALTVLDGPGHWSASSPLIDSFIGVDLLPAPALFARALAAVRASGLRFDAVATFDEFAGPLAAALAAALGLPGHAAPAIRIARDKGLTRDACRAARLANCRYARIEDAGDLTGAAAAVGFPAVLKPVCGAGTVQTYLVNDAAALDTRWHEVMAALPEQNMLAQSDDGWYDLMWSADRHMILEQELAGPKYDADCLLDRGRCVYMDFVLTAAADQLRDTRRILPAPLDAACRRQLQDYVMAALQAAGFVSGVFNVEVVMTAAGPVLVEINARMSGHAAWEMHRAVSGVDLVEQYLRLCLGLPAAPAAAAAPLAHVAESLLPAPVSGVIADTDFLRRFANAPAVVVTRTFVKRGQRVVGSADGAPDWIGSVVTRGASADEAARALDAILAQVELPIERKA